MWNIKKLTALSLTCFSLTLTGCGESRNEHEIKGNVTINGKPIQNGVISFVPADGAAQTAGGTIIDGSYVAHVPPGAKTVTVLGNEETGEEPLYQGVPDSPTRKTYKTVTPVIYNTASTSPLKIEITGAKEGVDFALEGKAPSAAELQAR